MIVVSLVLAACSSRSPTVEAGPAGPDVGTPIPVANSNPLVESVPSGVGLSWRPDFTGLEGNRAHSWHWCAKTGALVILNSRPAQMRLRLSMLLITSYKKPAHVVVKGEGFTDVDVVNIDGKAYERVVSVPAHGRAELDFASDAAPFVAKGDPRTLIFTVNDFRATETS